MCQNQLGKRNLTEAQKTYLIGKEYEAQKKRQGSNNQYVQQKSESFQSGTFHFEQGKTAQKIADDNKIGYGTVIRAEQFSSGLDAAEAVSPGINSLGGLTPRKRHTSKRK